MLYSAQEIPIIQGECMSNNLYWLKFRLAKTNTYAASEEVFTVSWETWHKHFGHISYQSLQSLIKNKIVDSFNPDPKSLMSDYTTCVAAKMIHRPFPKTAMWTTKLGQLTYINLWGKYQIQSIQEHQYYILFVDDYLQYVIVKFLKVKNKANQYVKEYLMHQITYKRDPLAICMDHGMEFITVLFICKGNSKEIKVVYHHLVQFVSIWL